MPVRGDNEAMMNPAETELLQIAKDQGATVHQGYHMLAAQLGAMGRYAGAFWSNPAQCGAESLG